MSTTRVLHVLPHAGGGAETYIERLDGLPGFRFERFALTERGRPTELPGGLARLRRAIESRDLIHVHGDAAALACWPVTGRRPTVITLHGSHLLRRSSGFRGAIARAGVRRAFARAREVIAVSESELDYARALAPAAAERIELIRNGVPRPQPSGEDELRATREALRLAPGSIVALFVGELSERKQPVQFAEAIERARSTEPEIIGVIAGEGPLRARLEPLGGEGLRVLGQRQDVSDLLAASDVFVLPSLREGLSYALLEAMSLGRATIVSDCPGNLDAVGDAGLVFPAGDVTGMAGSLERLAADPELRASLAKRAAERARSRFSLSEMREATARAYRHAINRGMDRGALEGTRR
jgi:glycosyltransferase involved in cell wall biosynthesis